MIGAAGDLFPKIGQWDDVWDERAESLAVPLTDYEVDLLAQALSHDDPAMSALAHKYGQV